MSQEHSPATLGASTLADKIEAEGLCCLCDFGENYTGHGERKVVPFPPDAERELIVKALRAYVPSERGLRPAEGHCLLQVPQQTPENPSPCAVAGHCIGVLPTAVSARGTSVAMVDALNQWRDKWAEELPERALVDFDRIVP